MSTILAWLILAAVGLTFADLFIEITILLFFMFLPYIAIGWALSKVLP